MTHVLAIDDEDLARFTIREILEDGGFSVTTAANGIEAFDCLDRMDAPPDVILCDLRMPEMGGVEFLRQLALRKYRGAIIIISALDKLTVEVAEGLAKYREVNVRGRLSKPFAPDDLIDAVRRALDGD